jgi:hypothetical protein
MTEVLQEWQRENGLHRGNGYINLPLAILVKAKETQHPMWQEFTLSPEYRKGSNNIDSFTVACWVAGYLKEAR